jgi:Cof subfamily protein (haloacid dehalogenase superfamily)
MGAIEKWALARGSLHRLKPVLLEYNRRVPIRLIAIDIDGTLLDSRGQVPEANQRAIAAAVERGIEVALVTGRRYTFARPVAERIPAPLTMIVNNGALVRTSEGETHHRLLLERDVARRLIQATAEFRMGALVLFDRPRENQIIYELLDWADPSRTDYWRRNREYLCEMSPLEECLTEDPIQVMYTGGVERMRALARLLASLEFAEDFSVQLTEYPVRDFTLVDVLHPRVSKGATLQQWAGRRGYAREEVMAIGDNLNDREMLAFCGRPVVMGNSVPELRTDGWHVTATNDDAGVALAIERYALGGDWH